MGSNGCSVSPRGQRNKCGRCASVIWRWRQHNEMARRVPLSARLHASHRALAAVRAQDVVDSWIVIIDKSCDGRVVVKSIAGRKRSGGPQITFRNTSGRPIAAIAFDIDKSEGRADMSWSGKLLQPGGIHEFKARNMPRGDSYRRLRVTAVLFADQGADEGDPSTAHVLRFSRLGGLLETNRCLGMVNQLDPSKFDSASVTALLESVNAEPGNLDEALTSLPENLEPEGRFACADKWCECRCPRGLPSWGAPLASRVQHECARSDPAVHFIRI